VLSSDSQRLQGTGFSVERSSHRDFAQELGDLQKSPLAFANVAADDNLYLWRANIQGPEGSPYEGGVFSVQLSFDPTYPIKAPEVRFLTKIYHPNVSMKANGQICQEMVTKDWSPVLRVSHVLERVYSMLKEPNGEHPLEAEIGEMFNENLKKFKETAQSWTKKHAKPS